jgi:transposase
VNDLYDKRKEEFQAAPTCVHCSEPKAPNSFCCAKHQKKALPWKLTTNFFSLRAQVLQTDEEAEKDPQTAWQTKTPCDTRQLAVQEAATAFKAAITNKVRGNIAHFRLGFKSRRAPTQVFCVNANAIKKVMKSAQKCKKRKDKKCKKGKKCTKGSKKGKSQPVSNHAWLQMFPTRLGEEKYVRVRRRAMAKVPDTFEHACKIMKTGKHYYLLYVIDAPTITEPSEKAELVSLDPGIRTFQTGYSPSGIVFKAGHRQSEQLSALHARLDALRSLRAKSHQKQKQRIRRACLRIEHKLKMTIANLHNQTANFIAKSFQTVLLPKFSTSEMQKGATLSRTSKRDLWTFSHYQFQQKLLGLCNRHRSTLYLVDEHYTTKTCGACGALMNVGKSKVFQCTECSYKEDRDAHGARNILLKHLTQFRVV